MEIPITVTGEISPCQIFYLRMADCVRRESFYELLCKNEIEDFSECRTRRRHVK